MSLSTIIVVVLLLMLVGAIPTWSYNRSWGYAPSGFLGTALVIVIILMVLGKF
jgi:hypothetical protein